MGQGSGERQMVFATETDTAVERVTKGWKFAVAAGILGWVLDAFDFFIMVFLFDTLAGHFQVSKASVVYTLTLTLAMRPLGALFFGSLADRFGRKGPLIVCVLYFSSLTVLSGLAPNYIFLWSAAPCTVLAWEATGASARRMRWKVRRVGSEAFCPA
jgi:SHS family lactate transporter-like MFS transporter